MSSAGFIVSYLINSVWEVTLIAGAGWLIARLLKRLGSRAEHVTWVSTLAIAILAPAAPLLRSLFSLLPMRSYASGHLSIALAASPSGGTTLKGFYFLPAAVVWPLSALYLVSLLYFALKLAWSLHRTCALLRSARPLLLTPQQDEIWRHCKQIFSLSSARILSSPGISGPVVLGWREPALLVPAGFTAHCTPPDLLTALAHECAHAKRRDFQKNLFYEAVSLVLAFHPALWAIKAQIAQTREMVCDGMVTERVVDSRTYAHSLLRLAGMVAIASRVSTAYAIGIFDANILEKRIMSMNLKKRQVSCVLKYGLIVPAMLFLLSVAVGAAAMAVVIEPQSPSQNSNQASPYGHIYKVGKDVTAPVVLKSIEAKFPKSAQGTKVGFNAIVLIRLIVDAEGMPQDVHISRSYNADFDAEAIKAVKQYQFKPAERLGKPVAVAISIEVDFGKY